jgi:phosphohistidine phosphatase
MRLYIVRHSIAELRNIHSPQDEDRALTAEGIEKMQQEAEGLKTIGFIPDVILTSPLVRARQTAEILLEAFDSDIPMTIHPDLSPGGDRGVLYRDIAKYRKTVQSLMLVGHQPSLGEIAGEIAWESPDCYIELKKGGVCVIDLESLQDVLRGRLVCLLTPSVLRRIKRGT